MGSEINGDSEKEKGGINDVERKVTENCVPFEEALDITGFGVYNYRLFAVSMLLLLVMVLNTFGVSFTVTSSACDLQLNTHTKGLIAAMPMLGMVLSAYLWGWLADTRGRRSVLLLSMLGSWLFSSIGSLTSVWPALAVCKFLGSFFASAANSVTYALFGECTPRSLRNKMVLMMSGGLLCGQALMSIIAYPILSSTFSHPIPWLDITFRPWRLLELMYGASAGLGALLLIFVVKESPKFYASRGREDESLAVLRSMYCMNFRKKADDFPVTKILFEETVVHDKDKSVFRSMWEQTTPLFRPPLLGNTIIVTYIVIVVYVVSPSFLMWMPSIISSFFKTMELEIRGQNFCQIIQSQNNNTTNVSFEPQCNDKIENETYIILIIFSLTLGVLNTLNSFLLRVLSKRTLVVFYLTFSGACGVCLPWIQSDFSVIVFLLFLMQIVCMALTTSFTVELYPTYLRAMAVCLSMMTGRGSSFLAISYTGVLMESYCEVTFYAFGAALISGASVGLLLPPDQKVT